MERFFAASQNSPLQMLRMLDKNLRRERRIFAVAVGLLIFAASCGAIGAFAILVNLSFRNELHQTEAVQRGVNLAIFYRYNTITTGALLLEVNAGNAAFRFPDASESHLCDVSPPGRHDAVLSLTCEDARHTIPRKDPLPRLEFASYDGAVSYGFDFFAEGNRASVSGDKLAALVSAARYHLSETSIDPVEAARSRRVLWFRAPSLLGFPASTLIFYSLVAKDGQPYGFVFTRLSLDRVLQEVTPDSLESQIAIFDSRGGPMAGDATDYTRFMDKHLAMHPAGVPAYTFGHGWGLRLAPLDLDVGHVVGAMPPWEDLDNKRTEIGIIALVTGALIALLLVTYRYWNRKYLTRTYEQACKAVEGEILNHLLVQATPVGLCIALGDGFHLLAANQVARTVLELDADTDILPPALRDAFTARDIRPPPAGAQTRVEEFQYAQSRPQHGVVQLKIFYTSAIVNKTHVLFCAIADITEQHEAAQVLRIAKETSEAAARAKLSFFASMSHEIRTPLSSLVGNLELVALGPLEPEQDARVHAMQASASALLQVVNDVLDFSKMDIGEMRLSESPGSIRALIMRVIAAHAPLANRQGLRLFAVIDRTCPDTLCFDAIRLSQILNNLLGNALKFTPSGKIVVRARWIEAALELSVADSGIGIPANQRDKLFQPFMQSDTQSGTRPGGTGLGLSICVRLCELMGGRISLDSTEGVGTRVAVVLPLQAGDTRHDGETDLLIGHPAIMCHASEYREWFETLYDPRRAALSFVNEPASADLQGCTYLAATDEFTDEEIASCWPDRRGIIHATQGGPLVPAQRADGSLEVSVFSLTGFREAVRQAEGHRQLATDAADFRASDVRATRTTGPTVLIAEDNRLNRALLRDQLLTVGAYVLESADGFEALELLRRVHVDVVLSDMDMPGMSGAELLDAARALHPAMPVYAISASASPQNVADGRARGFTDYLTKPIALATLAGVLQTCIAEPADDQLPRFPVIPASFVDVLIAQIDEDIVTLDEIIRERDARKLRRWAHKIAGGLSMLGPSVLGDECEELRAVLRETGRWVEDVDTFVSILRRELIALRDLQHGESLAQHQRGAV